MSERVPSVVGHALGRLLVGGAPPAAQFGVDPGYGFGGRLAYVVALLLAGVGLYVLVDDQNLVKKVIGLNVFQTGIFLFFVASSARAGGRSPTLSAPGPYANPVPQVLILTAIVVGVSVTAVALALVVRISREFGTLRADVVGEALDGAGGTGSHTGPPGTDRGTEAGDD
jgi:multicomponent Na+:H+ antiporter subunit C